MPTSGIVQSEAIQRLVKATPALLVALETLIGQIERDERIIMRDLTPGRAAIRAARGEG